VKNSGNWKLAALLALLLAGSFGIGYYGMIRFIL
jgi:hypothetical protein